VLGKKDRVCYRGKVKFLSKSINKTIFRGESLEAQQDKFVGKNVLATKGVGYPK
jgi:hypothetical protein